MSNKELVFGHQNPDTDAITAAMAFSYFQNQLGYETEAVALGEPNDETKYALDHFGMKAPRVVKTVANEVDKVMLVDHNEPQQSVSDLDKVTVTHLVDHHRIANFNTAQPLWITARPYGCVSTIITELFQEKHINIPANLAGMMLSAIISDTLLLKSPTTTDHDREAVKELPERGNAAGLRQNRLQPGKQHEGGHVPPSSEKRHDSGDHLPRHDAFRHGCRKHCDRTGFQHSGTGTDPSDLHFQPGLSGGGGDHRTAGISGYFHQFCGGLYIPEGGPEGTGGVNEEDGNEEKKF